MVGTHRLTPRSSHDTEGDVQRLLDKLEQANGDNLITRLLANSPNGFRPYVLMSNGLLNRAVLPPRLREFAILAIAREQGVAYEWWEHVRMSADAGVTEHERALISARKYDDTSFSADAILAMRIALSLQAGRGVNDDDWAAATDLWDTEGLLDLVLTSAWWGGFVPTAIQALRLDGAVPEDERPAWGAS